MREGKLSRWSVIGVMAAVVIGYSLQAAQNVFTGAVSNQWFNAGNWTLGIPKSSDDVVIQGSSLVILTNGDAVAKTVALNGNSILRIKNKARLNLFDTAVAMQVDTSASVEFRAITNPKYQEINLRDSASINIDGTIIGSNYAYIQNGQSGLSNVIVNGTLDESAGPVSFKSIIITGTPTIFGDIGLIVESGEIRLDGGKDIPYILASGFIGGTFSIRVGGHISNIPGKGDTTIDLAGITGAHRISVSVATVHIQNGLDPSGNLADGRTWEILKDTTLDFSGSSVKGITNNTSLEIHENAQIDQLALTLIEAGSAFRLFEESFDNGGFTLINNGTLKFNGQTWLSNITIEGTSPIYLWGVPNNVTFKVPVTLDSILQGTGLRCEAATTIMGEFHSDLVALGPVTNHGKMYVTQNGSIELLGGYIANADAALYAAQSTGQLRLAISNSTLNSGGIVDAGTGKVEFVGSPLKIVTNNTTYQHGIGADVIGEEITQIDAGSIVDFPNRLDIFDLNGRALRNDGDLKINEGTIANGTIQGTGNLLVVKSLSFDNITLDQSVSADYILNIKNSVITGDVTMLGNRQLSGYGRIEGHLSTQQLGAFGGTLELLGGLDIVKQGQNFVDISDSATLAITRTNPGSDFDYGSDWRVFGGGSIQLIGESGTSVALGGNTHLKFNDPQLLANFKFNIIRAGSILEYEGTLPMDMNGDSIQVDGSFIIKNEVANGTTTGSGIITAPSMNNMNLQSEAEVICAYCDAHITDSTFDKLVTIQDNNGNPVLVTNSTFNGPIQIIGQFDVISGTVNVLGDVLPSGYPFNSKDGGFLRINIGDTNGHLVQSTHLRLDPGGITEILGTTLSVIDSGASISMLSGELRNASIREIQSGGGLFITTDSLDLNGQNFLNNGELNLGASATLQNGTISGTGVVNVRSTFDNNDVLFNNITLQQPVLFHDATLRLNNSTLEQGATFFTKSTIVGSGVINGPLLIEGTIAADDNGKTLLLTGSLQPRSNNLQVTVKAINNAILELNLDTFGKADIVVEDATLTLDNPLTIDSQKTLTARGTITGTITNANAFSIGNIVGNLVITENYTQDASGTLNLKVGGTDPGQSDQLIVNGNANLAGKLNLKKTNGYRASLNDEIQVMKWSTHSGTFTNIKFPPTRFPKKKGKWIAEYRNDGLYVKAIPNLSSRKAGG